MEEHIFKDSREVQNYLVIAHGGTIINTQKVLMRMLDSSVENPVPLVRHVSNCSLTEFSIKLDGKTKKVTGLDVKNSTAHLDG